MSQAIEPRAEAYTNFNQFFTRELKPGIRQITQTENDIACPVDGCVSQIGKIDASSLIQAKNRYYYLKQLLADDEEMSN